MIVWTWEEHKYAKPTQYKGSESKQIVPQSFVKQQFNDRNPDETSIG